MGIFVLADMAMSCLQRDLRKPNLLTLTGVLARAINILARASPVGLASPGPGPVDFLGWAVNILHRAINILARAVKIQDRALNLLARAVDILARATDILISSPAPACTAFSQCMNMPKTAEANAAHTLFTVANAGIW